MGRTGSYFAFQQYGVKPDIVTMAKGIGNGIAVGAFGMTEEIAEFSLKPGDHGTTFGGNPLACTAVSKVVEIMDREKLVDHAASVGAYLAGKLDALVDNYSNVIGRRGTGLMQGLVLEVEAPYKSVSDIVNSALDKGLLLISAGPSVVRFVPPLTITEEQIDQMIEILEECL